MTCTKIQAALEEKEWLGNVPLSLKIFNDQILDSFFADTFSWSLNSAGRDAGFFPTKDELQIQCRDQRKSFERICCAVQSCMIVASYKLERIPAAKLTTV